MDETFRRQLVRVAHVDARATDQSLEHPGRLRRIVPRTVANREVALELFAARLRIERTADDVRQATESVRHSWYAIDLPEREVGDSHCPTSASGDSSRTR